MASRGVAAFLARLKRSMISASVRATLERSDLGTGAREAFDGEVAVRRARGAGGALALRGLTGRLVATFRLVFGFGWERWSLME